MRRISFCWLVLFSISLMLPRFTSFYTHAAVADYWLFAYNRATGEVIALQSDGTQGETLLTLNPDDRPVATRLAPNQMLIWVEEEGGNQVYYHLTPETATHFDPLENLPEHVTELEFVYPVDYHAPYVLFIDPQPPAGAGFVLNLESGEVEWLTGLITYRQVFFSEDGQFLRYASSTPDLENATVSVLERNLATQEERVISQIEGDARNFPFTSSPDGSYWIHRESIESAAGGRELHFSLIHLDGTQEEILISNSDNPMSLYLLRNNLLTYDAGCNENCPLEMRALDTGETSTYILPETRSIQPLALVGEDLIVQSSSTLWRLMPDGSALLLGYYAPQTISGGGYLISPDLRYVLTLDQDEASENIQVWDLQTGEMIVSEAHDVFASYAYFEDGFVVRDAPFEDIWYIPYETGEPFKLPVIEGGIFTAPSPDGIFFINQIRDEQGRTPGIYSYDPANDTYSEFLMGEWELLNGLPIFHPIR